MTKNNIYNINYNINSNIFNINNNIFNINNNTKLTWSKFKWVSLQRQTQKPCQLG